MSVKRQATTDLNHENWDRDDPAETEDVGCFKTATQDVLEKRVIRTAKRRWQSNPGDEPKKSVFSGFGGFNKTQPSSFDFLANLTNGNKTANGTSANNSDPAVSSSLFNNKSTSNSPSGGIFSIPVASTPTTNITFGMPTSQTSPLFGGSLVSSTTTPTIFTASKADSTLGVPLSQTQGTSSSANTSNADFTFKTTNANLNISTSQVSSGVFASPMTDTKSVKSLFSTTDVNSTPFKIQPTTTTSSAGQTSFNIPVSSTNITFGMPTSKTSLFGGSSVSSTTMSAFSSSKADSTNDITAKSANFGNKDFTFKPSNADLKVSTPQVSSGIFGTSSNAVTTKSLFSTSTTPTVQASFGVNAKSVSSTNESKNNVDSKHDDKKLNYYTKLKGLNLSVSDWIKQHVDKTPLCILTPIFKDYEKYLKEMQDEYFGTNEEKDSGNIENVSNENTSVFSGTKLPSSVFSVNALSPKTSSVFDTKNNAESQDKPTLSMASSFPNTAVTSAGFLFGINTTTQNTTATTNANSATPFSFGMHKSFSFNSNIQKPSESTNVNNEEEDEPPKVEYTPVVEDNSVYEKRCKLFVKKDGNFVDKGVGTLYIKKIEESGKHQLLIRANTNLGNVLLNSVLASAIPTQRMGKNNVMMVCIPTPDAKPPPTPILIRVKTSEEADELLETLNKYKA